jgi:hypothetical protein
MKGFVIEYRTNKNEYKKNGNLLFLTEREWKFYSSHNSRDVAQEEVTALIIAHKNNKTTAHWEFRIRE